jgi:putative SOS response-associated peptidase YedK
MASVTTEPNELCGAIHDRIPVILAREEWPVWLGEQDATVGQLIGMRGRFRPG